MAITSIPELWQHQHDLCLLHIMSGLDLQNLNFGRIYVNFYNINHKSLTLDISLPKEGFIHFVLQLILEKEIQNSANMLQIWLRLLENAKGDPKQCRHVANDLTKTYWKQKYHLSNAQICGRNTSLMIIKEVGGILARPKGMTSH